MDGGGWFGNAPTRRFYDRTRDGVVMSAIDFYGCICLSQGDTCSINESTIIVPLMPRNRKGFAVNIFTLIQCLFEHPHVFCSQMVLYGLDTENTWNI